MSVIITVRGLMYNDPQHLTKYYQIRFRKGEKIKSLLEKQKNTDIPLKYDIYTLNFFSHLEIFFVEILIFSDRLCRFHRSRYGKEVAFKQSTPVLVTNIQLVHNLHY